MAIVSIERRERVAIVRFDRGTPSNPMSIALLQEATRYNKPNIWRQFADLVDKTHISGPLRFSKVKSDIPARLDIGMFTKDARRSPAALAHSAANSVSAVSPLWLIASSTSPGAATCRMLSIS